MSIIQVSFVFHVLKHDMDFGQVQVMAFVKEMMAFPSYLVVFLTKLPSKRHEKVLVTFFTGCVSFLSKLTQRYNFNNQKLIYLRVRYYFVISFLVFITGRSSRKS